MGEAPIQAEAKGKDVSLWFTFQSQQGAIDIEMNGSLSGDTMKGPLIMGGNAGGDWLATRAKGDKTMDAATSADAAKPAAAAAKIDLAGTWNLTITLPEMTASPSLTLKQDGDKLSGQYVSAQYGSFPLTGTLTGSSFTLTFGMNVEGNALTVTYSGTVEKDTMKGSVSYGDMMSGTFTGTRKQ
jgi:hypothetical protein